MAWNDKAMMQTFLQLKDEFKIDTFVETGTYKGFNAELYSHYFKDVITVEINKQFVEFANQRLKGISNVKLYNMPSWEFLIDFKKCYDRNQRSDIVFFYFDAHFYDPNLPKDDKWVIIKELMAIEGFRNSVICIHDFKCEGLGHLNYAGEHLNWELVGSYLNKINENFVYYTNSKDTCDINDDISIKKLPITIDDHVLDAVKFVNSSDWKKYRGVLYASPKELDLNILNLKRL